MLSDTHSHLPTLINIPYVNDINSGHLILERIVITKDNIFDDPLDRDKWVRYRDSVENCLQKSAGIPFRISNIVNSSFVRPSLVCYERNSTKCEFVNVETYKANAKLLVSDVVESENMSKEKTIFTILLRNYTIPVAKSTAINSLVVWDEFVESHSFRSCFKDNLVEIWDGIDFDVSQIRGKGGSNRVYALDWNSSRIVTSEHILLLLAYILVFLYISLVLGRVDLVKSRFGLGAAAVSMVFYSFVMSVGLCDMLGLKTSLLVPWEVLPFLVIATGVENIYLLTNAVVTTSLDLPVKERVGQGLKKVGVRMTLSLTTETSMLLAGSFINIPALQEFCLFAVVSIVMDFFMQITFFVATLSIDIRRLELADLHKLPLPENAEKESNSTATYSKSHKGYSWTALFVKYFKVRHKHVVHPSLQILVLMTLLGLGIYQSHPKSFSRIQLPKNNTKSDHGPTVDRPQVSVSSNSSGSIESEISYIKLLSPLYVSIHEKLANANRAHAAAENTTFIKRSPPLFIVAVLFLMLVATLSCMGITSILYLFENRNFITSRPQTVSDDRHASKKPKNNNHWMINECKVTTLHGGSNDGENRVPILPSDVTHVAASTLDREIIVWSGGRVENNPSVAIWDFATKKLKRVAIGKVVRLVGFEKGVVAAVENGLCLIWKDGDVIKVRKRMIPEGRLKSLKISESFHIIVSVKSGTASFIMTYQIDSDEMRILNGRSCEPWLQLTNREKPLSITALGVSPCGKWYGIGTHCGRVIITNEQTETRVVLRHMAEITSLSLLNIQAGETQRLLVVCGDACGNSSFRIVHSFENFELLMLAQSKLDEPSARLSANFIKTQNRPGRRNIDNLKHTSGVVVSEVICSEVNVNDRISQSQKRKVDLVLCDGHAGLVHSIISYYDESLRQIMVATTSIDDCIQLFRIQIADAEITAKYDGYITQRGSSSVGFLNSMLCGVRTRKLTDDTLASEPNVLQHLTTTSIRKRNNLEGNRVPQTELWAWEFWIHDSSTPGAGTEIYPIRTITLGDDPFKGCGRTGNRLKISGFKDEYEDGSVQLHAREWARKMEECLIFENSVDNNEDRNVSIPALHDAEVEDLIPFSIENVMVTEWGLICNYANMIKVLTSISL